MMCVCSFWRRIGRSQFAGCAYTRLPRLWQKFTIYCAHARPLAIQNSSAGLQSGRILNLPSSEWRNGAGVALALSQQLRPVFGWRLAEDLLEHPVEVRQRLEADLERDFTHPRSEERRVGK